MVIFSLQATAVDRCDPGIQMHHNPTVYTKGQSITTTLKVNRAKNRFLKQEQGGGHDSKQPQEPENSGGILCGKSITTTMKVNKAKNVFLNKGDLIKYVCFFYLVLSSKCLSRDHLGFSAFQMVLDLTTSLILNFSR